MISFYKTILCLIAISFTSIVIAQGDKNEGLSQRQEAIVNISSLTSIGDLNKLEPALRTGLDQGLTVNEIKEVLIHLYAYCGFPRSLRGIQTFMEVLDERKAKGITDKAGRAASPITDKRSKYERGKENLAKLSGMPQDSPAPAYAVFAPEIEVFLKEHLFADLFERDVLSYAERELITVSVNASIGGVEPMLKSHMALSLNTGITSNQLNQLTDLVGANAGKQRADTAKMILRDVLKNKGLNADIKIQADSAQTLNAVFPKGEKTPKENFTGTAWVSRLVQMDASGTYSIGNVIFEPGARTNWHLHPAGQTLLVLDGEGWHQIKGQPARAITKGDVIQIPANTEHWHGAAKESSMTHLAITNRKDGGVKWLQPVTNDEYNSVQLKADK